MAGTAVSSKRSRGRVVAIALGAVVVLLALAVIAAGSAGLLVDGTQRDADGFFTTVAHRYDTSTHAITHEGADLTGLPGSFDTGKLATVRISASAAPGSGPVFVGIAPQASIDTYLAGVAHDRLRDIQVDPFRPSYARVAGTATPAAPAGEGFWTAQASGLRPALSWRVQKGTWGVVVMNADGSAHVAADISLGVKIGYLGWVMGGVIGVGILLLAVGGLLVVLGLGDGSPGGPRSGEQREQSPGVAGAA